MKKISNFKTFNFTTLNGETVIINCWVYSYSGGWGHRACLVSIGSRQINQEKYISYSNSGRTWEGFRFETLLFKVVGAFFKKDDQKFIRSQIRAIENAAAEEAEAWFNDFVKKYNSLSDSTKEKIKNSDIMLNSKDEADALINSALLLDSIN